MKKNVFCCFRFCQDTLPAGPAAAAKDPSEFLKADSMEFRMKENRTIYRKNVRAVVGKNLLTADYAVDDKNLRTVEMSGNINGYYIDENTGTLKIKADNGKYDALKEESQLWGNCWMVYTSSDGRSMEITADRISLDGKTKIADITGNVNLAYENNTARTQFAKYYHQDRKVVMMKENNFMPVVNYSNGYKADFTAEKITLMPEEKKLYFESSVFSKIAKNR